MSKNFTLIILWVAVLFTGSLHAQQLTDPAVLFKSGRYIPEENMAAISKDAPVFKQSFFGGRHYVVIQFTTLPDSKVRVQLAASGIELIDYLPNNAYTAVVPADISIAALKALPVRSIFRMAPHQKAPGSILNGVFPPHAVKQPGYIDVTVITFEKLTAAAITPSLQTVKAVILEDMPMFRSFTIRVAQEKIKALAELPYVQWIEPIDPPNQAENLLGRSLHRVNVLNDGVRNLKGDGINIGIWDEDEVSPHLDFSPAGRMTLMETSGAASSHSTHCAGTICGRGLINPKARGMAPNAKLYSYNFNGNIQTEMANAIPALNLVVSSHSYGSTLTCGLNGAGVVYSATSRATDLNLNNFPFHLHIHSAGNSQASCTGGWSTITASGKSAKNNILVANITTAEVISGSSSFGPVQDGRVKPEISSFGTNVLSTYTPLNNYGTISGTSMATPGVAGTAALLVQRYKQLNSNALPPSSLIKNTICNTAFDLGNTGPDYKFGYGRINALSAVRILEDNRYVIGTIQTGVTVNKVIAVPAGTARLRVMLTWNDPAGAANANPALVNNLNLSVTDGSTTTLPWILDPNNPGNPATKGVNNVSNIEQVVIDNPPAGNYTMVVNGFAVPTGPSQEYALTWSIEAPYIEVTYPNGGESLSPGDAETITWDNTGVTGNQTVQYSIDNGANWTTLSTTIPANTTRLVWTVPNANTSTAKVKVFSGAVTDESDATFKILGTPVLNTGSNCSSGSVNFTWAAVANATHYDLYKLDDAAGQWVLLTGDITGTSYAATGLTPGASMWFTLTAKNNTTGAVSEKALGINRVVSSTGMGAIGSITGQNNICGAASNVAYSVPAVTGATTYTWSVPAGATITSGQGTTSILVNYPAGSGTGVVSVFASAGACVSTTATLNITSGSSTIAAPLSGGNQSQVACPPAPIPTLTATATVEAGHTLVWYTAATGGTVTASPTLNSIGTVTYYAASRNNSSGCESLTRTPVTLTISPAPAPTISASGPVTFCQGGSVVLTATAGASYLWSTGATSQAITVTAPGSYSVTVTQAGGCTSTSPATTVTVNALPAANITAGGATAFCQGGSVVLTASAGTSYLWNTGATSQAITVNTSGNYSVTVTNAAGCSAASAATTVSVSPQPAVTITASPYTRLYPGLGTLLTANVSPAGTYTYAWTNNGIATGTNTATLPVTMSGLGNYSVTVTNAGGCSNTSALFNISDSASARLFIYPSPNSGRFNVSYYTGGSNVTTWLVIYDAKGARVYSKAYIVSSPYQKMEVDLRQHGKGVYQVALLDNNGKRMATGSVVIQ